MIAEVLGQNQREWQGGNRGRRWSGGEKTGRVSPVWNMASETTTDIRSEKCFAAGMELCAIPSGAKRRDLKKNNNKSVI